MPALDPDDPPVFSHPGQLTPSLDPLERGASTMSSQDPGYWPGPEAGHPADGSAEYFEYLLTEEERAERERARRARDEATFAAAEARLTETERQLAQSGQDIFGRPLAPRDEPQAEAEP